MRVRVLARYVRKVGPRGAEKDVHPQLGKLLTRLGKVEPVESAAKKRTYKRRDMVPEQVPEPTAPEPVVELAEVVEEETPTEGPQESQDETDSTE